MSGQKGGGSDAKINWEKRDAERKRRAVRHVGVVRAVNSGDTVTLVKISGQKPSTLKEFDLSLMDIKAPTLGRIKFETIDGEDGPKKICRPTPDDDWAYESREYLRSRLIGKSVVYRVDYAPPQGNRVYGEIFFEGENIRYTIVEKGWAKFKGRELKENSKRRADEEELMELEEEAEKAKRGLFAGSYNAKRKINYLEPGAATTEEIFSFFEKNKNKPLKGLVEQVRSGNCVRVYIPSGVQEFPVYFSGISCDQYQFRGNNAPHAREAYYYTKHFLQHRDVTVILDGLDKGNFFTGTVYITKSQNIAYNLLQLGLASFVDWTVSANVKAEDWKTAELEAKKKKKLRLWETHTEIEVKKEKNAEKNSYSGEVVEIIDGSTIVVRGKKPRDNKAMIDRKIRFSSIMAPRLLNRNEIRRYKSAAMGFDNDDTEDIIETEKRKANHFHAVKAKDYLRSTILGKKVLCNYDYHFRDSPMWSVYVDSKNVSLNLLEKGLARVRNWGQQDTPESKPGCRRSVDYREMLVAEKRAMSQEIGVHSPASQTSFTAAAPNDISDSKKGAKDQLKVFVNQLKREERMKAVVEYVSSCTRYKLYLPGKHNLVIAFAISGLKSSSVDRNKPQEDGEGAQKSFFNEFTEIEGVIPKERDGKSIPANEAWHFARNTLHQRNVEVEIIDSSGSLFLGQLYFQGTPFASSLLEKGYTSLHPSAESTVKHHLSLWKKLELEAKTAGIGVWADYDEEEETRRRQERQQEAVESRRKNQSYTPEKKKVQITEVMTGSLFFFRYDNEETQDLVKAMDSDFSAIDWSSEPEYSPNKGDLVAAQFSFNKEWYRARVLKVPAEGEELYEVRFIDYGNTQPLDSSSIRKIDSDNADHKLFKEAKPLAHKGKLFGVKAPLLEEDYGRDAAAMLKELVWDKTLVADFVKTEGNPSDPESEVFHLTLGEEEKKLVVAGEIVQQGYAVVERSRWNGDWAKKFMEQLKSLQEAAKKERLNIWEYGDPPNSDDEKEIDRLLK